MQYNSIKNVPQNTNQELNIQQLNIFKQAQILKVCR